MNKPKVVVVMPAYNAQQTIEKTYREVISHDVVDLVIVVDDASGDETMKVAQGLDRVIAHRHPTNLGYGGNQKTCYQLALDNGADIVVMVHPDYQYTPKLIPAMVSMVSSGIYSCVLASRILGGGALEGGMPLWRYRPWTVPLLAGRARPGPVSGCCPRPCAACMAIASLRVAPAWPLWLSATGAGRRECTPVVEGMVRSLGDAAIAAS